MFRMVEEIVWEKCECDKCKCECNEGEYYVEFWQKTPREEASVNYNLCKACFHEVEGECM